VSLTEGANSDVRNAPSVADFRRAIFLTTKLPLRYACKGGECDLIPAAKNRAIIP